MPDLATHIIVPYLANKGFKLSLPVVLLGAVLPDASRALLFVIPYQRYQLEALHTPFVSLLVIIAISLLFRPVCRRRMAAAMSLGVASHYLLDLFQHHFAGGYYWLFPFSLFRFEIGLINPEDSLFFLPFLLVIFAGVKWRERRRAPGAGR
jgi:membrane-bound metal-dependent hydrolase YbcI (DUF457 family)